VNALFIYDVSGADDIQKIVWHGLYVRRQKEQKLFKSSLTHLLRGAAFTLLTAAAVPAMAQDPSLNVGLAAPITSLDPHQDSNSPNNAASRHIFDSLISRGGRAENNPQLAESWQVVDDTHWQFTLRKDVTFHDGSKFDADDVVASLLRARDKPTKAFAAYTRNIKDVVAKDPYTVVVETTKPDPLILNSLSRIRIISSDYANASVADFESGKAAIGTGPFKFAGYTPGDRIELVRNDKYFVTPSPWDKVTQRIVTEDGGRLASMVAGDMDLIENILSSCASGL